MSSTNARPLSPLSSYPFPRTVRNRSQSPVSGLENRNLSTFVRKTDSPGYYSRNSSVPPRATVLEPFSYSPSSRNGTYTTHTDYTAVSRPRPYRSVGLGSSTYSYNTSSLGRHTSVDRDYQMLKSDPYWKTSNDRQPYATLPPKVDKYCMSSVLGGATASVLPAISHSNTVSSDLSSFASPSAKITDVSPSRLSYSTNLLSTTASPTTANSLSTSGLIGLDNLGNTCFLNSIVQCLGHLQVIRDFFLAKDYQAHINSRSSMRGELVRTFGEVMSELWSQSSCESYRPSKFKNAISTFAPNFRGYNQHDAQEFLIFLLEGLHEDMNRITSKPKYKDDIPDSLSEVEKSHESWRRYTSREDSFVVDTCVGQLKSTLQCTVCQHAAVTFDPFFDLSLSLKVTPLPGNTTLKQCLAEFTKSELLDGDEKPFCVKCNQRQSCTKKFLIQRFPRILLIHIKRFSANGFRKVSSRVDFTHTLDMKPYAASDSTSYHGGSSKSYTLRGVTNHSGSIHGGHYTASCKHPQSGRWHKFNDRWVSEMSESSVCSSDAYVLFYEMMSDN